MLKKQRLLLLTLSVFGFSFSAFAIANTELGDTEMLLFDDIPSVLELCGRWSDGWSGSVS